jgi:hypothetical protein
VINGVEPRTDVPDPSTMKLGRGSDANALRSAAEFRRARRVMQDDEIARLERSVTTPVVELVSLPVAGLAADDIRLLAASLANLDGAP